jgi:uncharacterized membrane protein YeaQ/YmgE (transglycosylase-associated protein family)
MGIITWIFFGFLVGALAKWIMPGKDRGGFVNNVLVGIGGAMVGGFIGSALGIGSVTGFNFASLMIATGGALLLLWGFRKLRD